MKIFANTKSSEIDGFTGLKVIPLFDDSVIKDVEPLIETLNYLSEAALKMYCSELVSRVLFHDEGAASTLGLTKAQFARLREVEGFEAISKPNEQGGAKWQFYRDDIYHYRD